MNQFVRGWLLGVAGGIFLMIVLTRIPSLGSGGSVSDWISVIAGIVVVLASVSSVVLAARGKTSP